MSALNNGRKRMVYAASKQQKLGIPSRTELEREGGLKAAATPKTAFKLAKNTKYTTEPLQSSNNRNYNDQPEQSAKNLERFFSDNFLLQKKVASLFKANADPEEAISLVSRHAIANGFVYASLFKGLSVLGQDATIVSVWKTMQRLRKPLSPSGYTLLITSLVRLCQKTKAYDKSARLAYFNLGQKVWANLERHSKTLEPEPELEPVLKIRMHERVFTSDPKKPIKSKKLERDQAIVSRNHVAAQELSEDLQKSITLHTNVMLQLCLETADYGGFEVACNIFHNLNAKDVRTFTLMFRICAQRRDVALGIKIWSEMSKDSMDERCLSSFVLLLSKGTMEEAKSAIGPVDQYFGLGANPTGTETLPVSSYTLCNLLFLANTLQNADLGHLWVDMSVKRKHTAIDAPVHEALSMLNMTVNRYDKAWEYVQMLGAKKYTIGFRICREAVQQFERWPEAKRQALDPLYWYRRCIELYAQSRTSKPLSHADLVNLLTVYAQTHKYTKNTLAPMSILYDNQQTLVQTPLAKIQTGLHSGIVARDYAMLLAGIRVCEEVYAFAGDTESLQYRVLGQQIEQLKAVTKLVSGVGVGNPDNSNKGKKHTTSSSKSDKHYNDTPIANGKSNSKLKADRVAQEQPRRPLRHVKYPRPASESNGTLKLHKKKETDENSRFDLHSSRAAGFEVLKIGNGAFTKVKI